VWFEDLAPVGPRVEVVAGPVAGRCARRPRFIGLFAGHLVEGAREVEELAALRGGDGDDRAWPARDADVGQALGVNGAMRRRVDEVPALALRLNQGRFVGPLRQLLAGANLRTAPVHMGAVRGVVLPAGAYALEQFAQPGGVGRGAVLLENGVHVEVEGFRIAGDFAVDVTDARPAVAIPVADVGLVGALVLVRNPRWPPVLIAAIGEGRLRAVLIRGEDREAVGP